MALETGLTRGMENAQDPLNDNFQQLDPLLEDTGLVNLEAINGFTFNRQLQVRKIGKEVRIRGRLGTIGTLDINNPFCILPEKFRHNYNDCYAFDVGKASAFLSKSARIYVYQNGEINIIAHDNTDGYTILDQINYWVD